ncbi:WD repeat-containing protein 25 [Argiope bruennichi]|uniref:WD repeat-containing protein 25 n=1 Tax=Argiope bruennichi TaxID=94029 RepID=A0A8T0EQH0_ARGBR|nr:WD repeat-containing protein 25 [Argiope bruennichi]
MDLVSSYLSDGEMENHRNQEKAMGKSNEDQNSGEESDVVDILFESTASPTLKIQKPIDMEVDCICLDDSDTDNKEVSDSTELSKDQACVPAAKEEVAKKIDYLNLESSDTDDEQENIQNNVNNLLNSAAILNDIECGPKKPVPELEILNLSPSCSDDSSINDIECGPKKPGPELEILNISPSCSDDTSINDIECGPKKPGPELEILNISPSCSDDTSICGKRSNSPILSTKDHDDNSTTSSITDICKEDNNNIDHQEGLSNKKIKLDQLTTDCKDVDVSTLDGLELKMRMYRKDERIIEAYKKKHISRIPSILSQTITAHENVISSLSWCAVPYSHLLLSSSLDRTVKIWDIYSQNKPTQTLTFSFSVRASKWSKIGEQIIAGGFGNEAHIIDALSGKSHVIYKIHNHVSSIAIHPVIEDVILFGTKNAILGFDLRVNSSLPVRTFLSKCEEVLDIAFLNKNEFVCSTNVVSHDSADRTIMVWDFNSGAIMSNQIFLERYTCPSLKINPFDSSFIAQTNGDYIASFSSRRPYKRKKNTYIGHKVSGFGVECDLSPDGQYVASGDAKGEVYFYNYADATLVNKLSIKPDVAANKLQWHPLLSSTMAVATWDGQIHFWK